MNEQEILAILDAPPTGPPLPPPDPPDPHARPKHACGTCNRKRWWKKPEGKWICGLCHPNPNGDSAADLPVPPPPPPLDVDLSDNITAPPDSPDDPQAQAEVWNAFAAHMADRNGPVNAAQWSRWWSWHRQVSVPDADGRNDYDIMATKARQGWAHYLDIAPSDPLMVPGTRLAIHCKFSMSGPTMPWLKELPERNKGRGNCYTLTVPCRGWCKDVRRQASVILVGWSGAEELASQGVERIEGEGERAREVYGLPADSLHTPDELKAIVEKYR